MRAPVEINKSFTRLKANVTPNKNNPKLQKINEKVLNTINFKYKSNIFLKPTIDDQVEVSEKNADTSQPKEAIDINGK